MNYPTGLLPDEFYKLNDVEKAVCSITTHFIVIKSIQGEIGKKLISHSSVFRCDPGAPITLLPQSVKDNFYVIMGKGTPEQIRKIKTSNMVRYDMVLNLLAFYKTNNECYRDVSIKENLPEQESVAEETYEPIKVNELLYNNHNHTVTEVANDAAEELIYPHSTSL